MRAKNYLVGVTDGKTGQVVGPFEGDSPEKEKQRHLLLQEGADTVYATRADNHLEARRQVQAHLRGE